MTISSSSSIIIWLLILEDVILLKSQASIFKTWDSPLEIRIQYELKVFNFDNLLDTVLIYFMHSEGRTPVLTSRCGPKSNSLVLSPIGVECALVMDNPAVNAPTMEIAP